MPKATAAQINASNRLSVSSCQMIRRRDAPIASRMPISRCRATPRASSRLATFAHPITRIKPNAKKSGVNRISASVEHQFALTLRVLLAGARDEDVAAGVRLVLDGPRDRRVEGVRDVFGDQAEGTRAAGAQAAGEVVAREAELADGLLDARSRVGAHAGLPVHDARNRLQAHTRGARDVAPFAINESGTR